MGWVNKLHLTIIKKKNNFLQTDLRPYLQLVRWLGVLVIGIFTYIHIYLNYILLNTVLHIIIHCVI